MSKFTAVLLAVSIGLASSAANAQENKTYLTEDQRVWRDKRSDKFKYKTVYSIGSYGEYKADKQEFNQVFQEAEFGIMRRECADCRGSQHNDKFFVRKTSHERFDAWQYLLVTWSTTNNVFHKDFDIYDSLDDAIQDKNPWTYCNANDPGVGFPRDCGPTGYVPHIWNALPESRHYSASRKNYRYSVVQRDGPTTITTTTLTTATTVTTLTKTTVTATTVTATTTTSTSTTTTTTTYTKTTTSSTSSSYVSCGPGEKFIKRTNKCDGCPDGQFQSQKSHNNPRCEYTASSCKFREFVVTEATKTNNLLCGTSEECGEDFWESKRPEFGKKERECSALTECRDGEYESLKAAPNSDRECTECDGTYKAQQGGCITTTSTRTTNTRTTRTKTATTKTVTTKTTTTTATATTATATTATLTTSTSTTSTTTIKQPPINDLVTYKAEQTASGVSDADQIAAQIADNGVNVESLLSAGYSQDDVKAADVSNNDIQKAVSAFTQKADEIFNAVMDVTFANADEDATVVVDYEAMKAKMDDANIPRFIQVDNALSAGETSDGLTVELVTTLLNAGYAAADFDDTEVSKRQLFEAQTNAATGAKPSGGGGSTTIVAVVGVFVVLLVVVGAYIAVMKGNGSKNDVPPVSFENPMYDQVHNAGGGGGGGMMSGDADAYADPAGSFGDNGGAFDGGGTSGYMDIHGAGAAGAAGGGATSGYMDVGGVGAGGTEGTYDDNFDNGFDQEDGSDEDV